MHRKIFLVSLLAISTALAAQRVSLTPALAATPPMGWNSWNHFAGHITDADVRAAADQMVATGMRDAGYIYVNVDDTWQGERDATGELHPNSRFPDMKALGDYIHSKGLKFGIYSGPGEKTCAGYAGSLGHEKQDAEMYARWGVDYLKYDLCSAQEVMRKMHAANPNSSAEWDFMIAAYKKMGDALRATGRPIVYSLCQYGLDQPWVWGPSVHAQLWRTTDDINDSYDRMMAIAQSQVGLAKWAGPGHWNDPDMLEIGNGGMTTDEYKTHMTLWAVLAAPLIAGNDMTKMSAADKTILTNRDVIAIDQDKLGREGDRVWQSGDFSVWTRPLSGGRTAVAIVNGAWDQRDVPVPLAAIGFPHGADFYDVWNQRDAGRHAGTWTNTIPKHGVLLLIAKSAPMPKR